MKILCVAKNYALHAQEMQADRPAEPVFFLKPDSALLQKRQPFFYPDFSSNVQYELELVVRIDKVGKCIEERFAPRYYSSVALGIDFTARDLQQHFKDGRLPWALAKGFDDSAVLGPFVSLQELGRPVQDLHFELRQNGTTVQQGHTADMLFSVDQLIAYVSRFMTLKTGDLIYTGTPVGVGSVQIGDTLEGYLEGVQRLSCRIK